MTMNSRHGNDSLTIRWWAEREMPMHSNTQYTLRCKQEVPSRTEELFGVRQTVENEALRFGFDADTAFRLALAVDEACTNIIKHSYGGNPSRTFDIEIATNGDHFIVVLTDHGKHQRWSDFQSLTGVRLPGPEQVTEMARGAIG